MKRKKSILILSIISLSIFLIALMSVIFGRSSLDYFIRSFMQKMWNPLVDAIFIFMGNYSEMIMIFIVVVVAVFLYFQKRGTSAFVMIITLGIGEVLKEFLKLIIQRSRPAIQLITEHDYSFPSGHAVFSMILFSFLIYFYANETKSKARKFIFILVNIFLILLVGFSRIYLNVHWFSDVIGGYALGFFLFNLGVLFLQVFGNPTKSFIN